MSPHVSVLCLAYLARSIGHTPVDVRCTANDQSHHTTRRAVATIASTTQSVQLTTQPLVQVRPRFTDTVTTIHYLDVRV